VLSIGIGFAVNVRMWLVCGRVENSEIFDIQ